MKVCNLQVAMNNLAAGVEKPQGLVVIFQARGQGQLHVSTQAHCNTENIVFLILVCMPHTFYSIFIAQHHP